jgi:hypothetical protein
VTAITEFSNLGVKIALAISVSQIPAAETDRQIPFVVPFGDFCLPGHRRLRCHIRSEKAGDGPGTPIVFDICVIAITSSGWPRCEPFHTVARPIG